MKNIWLISYRFDEVMAGPSIRFQRYGPYFKKYGYQLHIVTAKLNDSYIECEEYNDFVVHRLTVPRGLLSTTRFVSKAIRYIINFPGDNKRVLTFVLQTYQLWVLPSLNRNGISLYYISTMAADPVFIKGLLGILWNKLHLYLYSILYKNINGVVCSTEALAATLCDYGLLNEKRFIINNGVDTRKFSPVLLEEKYGLRNRLGLPRDSFLFLFIGLKTERKGIRELIRTWQVIKENPLFNNAHLLLVGDEKTSANHPDFNDWWESFKTSDLDALKVRLISGVQNVEDWFRASDVFIFPSKKEGMPNVILEAMACGLPTITNRFEGYSPVYGVEGVTHLAFSHSDGPDQLESLISRMLLDDELRLKVGSKASQHIRCLFSIENSVSKFIELFED